MKTAAQKKKEKKEREKQKRAEQKLKESQTAQAVAPDGDASATTAAPNVESIASSAAASDAKSAAAGDVKKGKKAGPSRKIVAAMQDHLRKRKEEEERLQREEEEAQRRADEEEAKRVEAERLEKERKERKKQKEKEKRAQLKSEGKLLTAKQKAQRARAQATLESLRAQGVLVAALDKKPSSDSAEARPKKPRRMKSQASIEKDQPPVDDASEEPVQELAAEAEEAAEDSVADEWDAGLSSEEETTGAEAVAALPEPESVVSAGGGKKSGARKGDFRSPVVCVLGHVDTGKTKILDKIRRTNVQDGEAGGITQQIGATMIPVESIATKTSMVKDFAEIKVPGLLVIDTPGHESFGNLRTRGSSLCDIAILVVDIMHGLEPQTVESIHLLKGRKTPFIVALNKIDRLYQWVTHPERDVRDTLDSQPANTQNEFRKRVNEIVLQFAENELNVALFHENTNPREFISMVPTSAHSGDGVGNLMAMLVELSQSFLAKRITYSEQLQCTVLEVKALPGLGTTIDVILINGRLREGDTIVVAGQEEALSTQIRSLLMPQPLCELRVKNPYEHYKELTGAQGVKIIAKDLEKAVAGLPLLVAHNEEEIADYKRDLERQLKAILKSMRVSDRGVHVQASTIGSLEALLEFLRTSKVPYAGIGIGPVHKADVRKASIMIEHDDKYATILAFDVKIEREAQQLADELGVRIFSADIIYHLFDAWTDYSDNLKRKQKEQFRGRAVFPVRLQIMPNCVFNSRDPIVCGVKVLGGTVRLGTPLCVPSKDMCDIGQVTGIEINNKPVEVGTTGQEVCIKIDVSPGTTPKLFNRHFTADDEIASRISRDSIDILKEYFRDEMSKDDWQLVIELKKLFQII